jgi:putative effector of murein hydrolase
MTADGNASAGPVTGTSGTDDLWALKTMGLGYIYAWLAEDYWTMTRIEQAIEARGVTARQVAESFSLAAASMLSDVCGADSTLAAVLAATSAFGEATRQARPVLAR